MSERITRANLEERVRNLNRRMRERRSKYHYVVEGRGGYTALDRCFMENGREVTQDVVRTGTKSEIGEFLYAMMVALDDARRV